MDTLRELDEQQEIWAQRDIGRTKLENQDIANLLREIEYHRTQLAAADFRLSDWIEGSPIFAEEWYEFHHRGGITAADWEQFCAGTMRCKPVVCHRHVRLLVRRKNNAVYIHHEPDAA